MKVVQRLPSKMHNDRIYIKDELRSVLNTQELNHVNSAVSVLFFPDSVSLKRAKESLKIIETNLDDLIRKEEEESGEEKEQKK